MNEPEVPVRQRVPLNDLSRGISRDRDLLEEAGLNVELQVQIPGMGHLDLLVDGLLGIEADGYAHHASRDAYREDRRRWNVTVVRGVPTLRVTYEMLLGEPQEFVRLVRQALATYRSAQ